MANEEQLEIIRQGVKIWNAWRTANPTYKVDLTDVNLRELDLAGVNFGDADLRNCLISGDLTCSNFAKANLMGASLASANSNSLKF